MLVGQKAVTLYFSGKCQLKCSYCYLPKLPGHMNSVQKDIEKWMTTKKIIEDIYEVTGEDLEDMAFWGGEPTLSFRTFIPILPDVYKRFPKLRIFSFSSNIASEQIAGYIEEFISAVMEENKRTGRRIKVKVQLSLDGPGEVNNCARIGSDADEIVKSITHLLKYLVKNNVDRDLVTLHGKGTHDIAGIRKWEADHSTMWDYYDFYEGMYEKWSKITPYYPVMHPITYVYPGRYTKEDGEIFARFLSWYYEEFVPEAKKKYKHIKFFEEQMKSKLGTMIIALYSKSKRDYTGEWVSGLGCSVGGGDFGLGYDGSFHVCQGTFFFDDKAMGQIKTKNMVSEFEQTQGYSFRNFDSYIKDNWIFPFRNELRTYRALNTFGLYKESVAFREETNKTMIKQLAFSGLVLPKYLEKKHSDFFAMCIVAGNISCVANNLWDYGMVWMESPSVMKLWGNGALDVIMDQLKKDKRYNEYEL